MEYNRYLQRAKVYRLNDLGNWDDKGTGHVSVEYLERSEALGLVVIDEEDNATLLVHRISADDIYRRQEDTIISWRDPEVATRLALSFQETVCCSYIWDQICDVRRSFHFPTVGALDVGPRSANEVLEHLGTSHSNDGGNHDVVELPAVELCSLPQIVKILTDASVTFLDREQISSLIIKDANFIPKLVDLFMICEDVENMEGLHMLFKIAKALISLNCGHIFEQIFSDKYIMHIIGMLEYDPEVVSRQSHRAFLKEQVVFKEAVPIPDPSLLAKIHQTYRIGYTKDVILPNVLDNPTMTSLNSMILNNNVTVVSALLDHNKFVKSLFTELKSSGLTEQTKKDLVHFLQEFCSSSKSLQLPLRGMLFSSFVREGLFDVVTDLLGSADESLRLSGTDILILVLNYDASLLRKFLIQQTPRTLFSSLVMGMLTPGQGGVQAQLLEVMRMLLDCESSERTPPEKSPFLDVFYANYMEQIMKVLTSGIPSKKSMDSSRKADVLPEEHALTTAETLGNICELLCFCVQHHSYRIKNYVLRNQVMEKVLQLTTRRERHLVVTAVRFLRACIGRKDEFYYRYIVKNDLLRPVIQAFLANGHRYNLLNSAILELFKFIFDENAKSLISYVIEKYYDKLENISYVDTLKKLKSRYDQASEVVTARANDSGAVSSRDRGSMNRDRIDDLRRRKDDRALDKDEEEYFNEDSDDEEDTASVQTIVSTGKATQAVIVNGGPLSAKFGLVDYDDEDDDGPSVVRNNGTEEARVGGSVMLASNSNKESLWLDREEDKLFQNVKRKSILTSEVKEKEAVEPLKRLRMSVDACPNEATERPAGVKATLGDKTGSFKSFSLGHDGKGCNSKEEAKSTGKVFLNTKSAVEASGGEATDGTNRGTDIPITVTNGPGLVKAHGVAGS